jgi:hypothetical protein
MLIVPLQTAQKPFQYGLSLSFPQDLGVDVTRGAVDVRFFRTLTAKKAVNAVDVRFFRTSAALEQQRYTWERCA